MRSKAASGRFWWLVGLALAIVQPATSPAASGNEKLEVLMQQLRQDPSYKVRLSAALAIGRRGDRRAVAGLVDALGDDVATVRAVCAGALGKLVDRRVPADLRQRALTTLEQLQAKDPDSTVRRAATGAVTALREVERLAKPRPLKGSIFMSIRTVTDGTGKLDAEALSELTEATRDALLAGDPSIVTEWPGGEPSAKALKKAKSRGAFTLMGNVSELEVKEKGKRASVKCRLKLVLSTYPRGAVRGFINGAAGVETTNREGSIERAKTKCATEVIKHLMKSQVLPDVREGGR